ncbi:heterokaryon incompatibility protein-domain-containing protein [Clohesyomyces aquaticus]|uniref:Heterokaryon incompatibility protein-domain-containing protein n=1 Tax=Clohesyomyces aquaticus TaxID=1231657 RepID=A0A1Y1Z655_9PLEO|nr:heterokaryon incompatibility protein-domain-containing protein [Clohesyomyces aquaticus]
MPATDAIEQLEHHVDFKHSPLNLESRQIRLLKLVPGTSSEDREHIHAIIQHFNLSEVPPFKALSYTWGKPHPSYNIYINEKPFSVRENLHAFLETVTSDPEFCTDVWLWIDQVCIQQIDTKERNHQVRQMPDIYRSASEVIVWLGPGTTYNERLLRGVAKVKENPTAWSNLTTRAAVELLGCEYWTRTWVIQEFILAPSIVFCWGDTRFGFDDLVVILELGSQHIRDRHCQAHSLLQKITHITELASQKKISRENGFTIRNWKTALTLSLFTNCQDVRDRIYALLGLVDPHIAVYPDYSASPKDIFVDILAGVVAQCSNLDVGQEEDFLATKALVSRALGLGNRPLDELKGLFFDELRNDSRRGNKSGNKRGNKRSSKRGNKRGNNAFIDSKAKAVKALRAWIVEDDKHMFGLQVSFSHLGNITTPGTLAGSFFGLDKNDKSFILVYNHRPSRSSLEISSQHVLCLDLGSGERTFPGKCSECSCVSFR